MWVHAVSFAGAVELGDGPFPAGPASVLDGSPAEPGQPAGVDWQVRLACVATAPVAFPRPKSPYFPPPADAGSASAMATTRTRRIVRVVGRLPADHLRASAGGNLTFNARC